MGKQKTLKRSALRTTGASALVAAGIYFDSKNEGAHLVVSLNKDGKPLADYWPGANHWRTRKGGIRGRGAESLISYLQTGKLPKQQAKVESLTLVAHPDDHAAIRRFAQELAGQRLLQTPDCGACGGTGWVIRDPDIGTEQECFVCNYLARSSCD